MRSVKYLAAASLASLLSTTAFAADLPSIMPPPMPYAPPAQEFGGWYLRGDIGMSNQHVKKLHNALYDVPGTVVTPTGIGFDSAPIFGVGVGYQFNNWFRADVTGEYRGKANFHGMDIAHVGAGPQFTDLYTGSKSEALFLANIYADLGTWWCLTPFIGAGVGVSRNTISSFTDTNTPLLGVAYGSEASQWNFAWAAHAGIGYKVTNNLTVELAYRYVDMGNAHSGDIVDFTGANTIVNPMEFKSITSHDLKLGVRWTCCDVPPPPPPPLVRKG